MRIGTVTALPRARPSITGAQLRAEGRKRDSCGEFIEPYSFPLAVPAKNSRQWEFFATADIVQFIFILTRGILGFVVYGIPSFYQQGDYKVLNHDKILTKSIDSYMIRVSLKKGTQMTLEFRFFTPANSVAIRIANEIADWKEAMVIENVTDEKRIVGGINYILDSDSDRKERLIQTYEYTPPMMCCHYWEITLKDNQKIVVKYCTNEEKILILVRKNFTNLTYMSRLSNAMKVLMRPCSKCKT